MDKIDLVIWLTVPLTAAYAIMFATAAYALSRATITVGGETTTFYGLQTLSFFLPALYLGAYGTIGFFGALIGLKRWYSTRALAGIPSIRW